MFFQHFMCEVGGQEANMFLIADPSDGSCVLVDAGALDPLVIEMVAERGLRVEHVLLTHLHFDHVDGLSAYLEQWPTAKVASPGPIAARGEILLVADGDRIGAGALQFDVLATPGHTPDSVSYYFPRAGMCFVGDALFAGSVGGTIGDEHHAELLQALQTRILSLPDSTELWCGHGPMTTVGIERAANPFFTSGFARVG